MVTFPGGVKAEAVIFDFDGVIVDTEPLHYAAFQRLLEPRGLGFSWEQYVETYMGFDDRDAFIEAFKGSEKGLASSELLELIEQKALLFQEVIRDGISAYPGVVNLIRGIHSSRTPLAISSGALRSDIDPILHILGIADCFDVIVTADDVAKSKPDPECYRLANSKLNTFHSRNVPAQLVLAIEDTPAGIAAAKGAGLQVLAVTNSYPAGNLSQADIIIETLEHPEIRFDHLNHRLPCGSPVPVHP
jgi:beta-phosphoglucomutase